MALCLKLSPLPNCHGSGLVVVKHAVLCTYYYTVNETTTKCTDKQLAICFVLFVLEVLRPSQKRGHVKPVR